MKDRGEDTTDTVGDVYEDILSDDTDAAKSWIPVALKLVRCNADMEV